MSHVFSHEVEDLRDFYQILGVSHEASADEIRRAYRSLALKYHPDRNSGSREAEDRFKELAEAFRTLSDPDRRAVYDVWGPRPIGAGLGPGPREGKLDDAVAVFVEQFSAFVNEEVRDWDASLTPETHVPYLPIRVQVTLREVASGVMKEIAVPCASCAGTGIQRARAGHFDSCRACSGSGDDESGETVSVEIPGGASSGDRIRVHRRGGESFFAVVEVKADPRFTRAGADVVLEFPLSSRRAITDIEVPTPTGSTRVRLPQGTAVGGALRIQGQGLPIANRPGGFGDLIVKLVPDEGEVMRRPYTRLGEEAPTPPKRQKQTRAATQQAPTPKTTVLTGLSFLLGALTFALLGRAASEESAAGWAGVGFSVLLVLTVSAASLFLISSLLAFAGTWINDRIEHLRGALVGARERMLRWVGALELRLHRFAARERRPTVRPLVVQLDRLAEAVEHAGEGQIATLTRLERNLADDVANLSRIQPPYGWSSDQVAQRLRESARHAADSFVAAPLLLVMGVLLGLVDFWLLRLSLTSVLPAADGLPFPLSWLDPASIAGMLLAFGAVASGALRQALEPLEMGPTRGERVVERRGYPLLLGMGPTLMAFVIMVLQALSFFMLSLRVDLATRLGLPSLGRLTPLFDLVVPAAGFVLTLLLVSLGYAFWRHVRQAFAADADGAVARRLRRHSEQRGSVPMDVQSLRTHVAELATRLEGFSKGITGEFARATGLDDDDQTVARSVRAAAARVSERGVVAYPRGLRSLEQLTGSLAVGTAGFLLLFVLMRLLVGALFTAFENAAPFQSAPADALALAATLLFALSGYLIKDALYGSNHAATLLIAIPQRRGREMVAAALGAGLLIGIGFVAWLGAAGRPLNGGAGINAFYLMLLATATAAASVNLDGWAVSAFKLVYLVLHGSAWLTLTVLRAALGGVDWMLGVATQLVTVLSIPGQWVRSKAFRTA